MPFRWREENLWRRRDEKENGTLGGFLGCGGLVTVKKDRAMDGEVITCVIRPDKQIKARSEQSHMSQGMSKDFK